MHSSAIGIRRVVETHLYMYSFLGVWSNFHGAYMHGEIIGARKISRDGNMYFAVWVDH